MKTNLKKSIATSLVAASILFGGSASAQAAQYYRSWHGWKAPQVAGRAQSYSSFANALNQVFFPETIRYGAGKSLTGYLPSITLTPAVLNTLRTQTGLDLPDELALVVYESESSYQALRATPEGKAYADLHKEYFNMAPVNSKSKSLTPGQWTGNASAEAAYDVLQSDASWNARVNPSARVIQLIHARQPGVTDAAYLQAVTRRIEGNRRSAGHGLDSYVVSVRAQYWVEYQLWSNARDAAPILARTAEWKTASFNAVRAVAGQDRIQYGEIAHFGF